MKSKLLLILLCFSLLQKEIRAQELHYRVLFDYDKSDIPDSSLIGLMKMLHAYPIQKVLIEGHCDSIGSKFYNLQLSERRAASVKKLLTDNGLASDKIRTCLGYGKDRPLNNNANEKDRSLNRRVMVTLYYPEIPLPENVKEISPIVNIERKDFKKEDFTAGASIVLNNLLFDGGSHRILRSSFTELNKVVNIMKQKPTLEIQLEGHVCCTTDEPDGYDWDTGLNNLSVARARAVTDYLVEQGISPERLRYKGFGGTKKINEDESTETLKRINRRVEMKVIKE
ncbi:MAG: OmpA family protein [Chitinophagaceae bacterium]|nr:OmpA family protein [Chitinophagaceae bacterium]